jgi:3-oxoacyl-[acyl-carrier protein] reductase
MAEKMDFKGRFGIITGAANGIGRASALELSRRGAGLLLADIEAKPLNSVADEISAGGGKALGLETDVSREDQVRAMVDMAMREFGRIDFLVTSAGDLQQNGILEMSLAEWDRVVGVNLRGLFMCCHMVAPIMAEQKSGAIVNVASLAGRSTSVLGGPAYTSSKAGVIGLTRHIARELAPLGVRANAFCPGATKTRMITNAKFPGGWEAIAGVTPLRRISEPHEQARAVAFLAGEDSCFMTGACLDSNGGALML